jgi:hypothetical protein
MWARQAIDAHNQDQCCESAPSFRFSLNPPGIRTTGSSVCVSLMQPLVPTYRVTIRASLKTTAPAGSDPTFAGAFSPSIAPLRFPIDRVS